MQKYVLWLILFILLLPRLVFYFSTTVPYKVGDRVRVSTKVTSEPIRYEKAQYLKIHRIKVYLPLYPEIYYGDKIVVEGVVEKDKKGEWRLIKPELIEIKEQGGSFYVLRKKLLNVYKQSLPQPHSSLVAGVTIGSKSDIPSSFWETLKNSGTAHVVVASGMNVSLVAGFLMSIFVTFISRRKALLMTLVGVWLYALMSGFDAPIVRAAVMGSITFSAVGLGRIGDAKRALLFSGFLMILFFPDWVTDIGFWLSFVATGSILFFQKPVKKIVSKLKVFNKLGFIKEDLITTLAAQVGVAPILYFAFGQFNLLSPFINAAVLWTIPLITVIGMIGGLIGLIYVPLGNLVLYLTFPLTLWFTKVVEFAG
jgi:competence protein ComEC